MNPKAIIELGGELAPELAAEAKAAGAKLLSSAGLADAKTVVVDGATKTVGDTDVIMHSVAFPNAVYGDELELDAVLGPRIPSWGPSIETWGGSRTSFAAPFVDMTEREAALAKMSGPIGFDGILTGDALTRWQNVLAAAGRKGK